MARAKARGGWKGKAARGRKRKTASRRRVSETKARRAPQRKATTARAFPATDADNDMIPSKEVVGIREGPVRCETCNTDFASRQDFERHAAGDHPDFPAKVAQ